jgi:hypothetical protein
MLALILFLFSGFRMESRLHYFLALFNQWKENGDVQDQRDAGQPVSPDNQVDT